MQEKNFMCRSSCLSIQSWYGISDSLDKYKLIHNIVVLLVSIGSCIYLNTFDHNYHAYSLVSNLYDFYDEG